MKINSIRLKNIHSFKGVHQVEFQSGPLAGVGLFAITGPTGAGKSTLLDVITLALFNNTPRSGVLSKSAIERNGAVITRNTDDAFCEVEYESGGWVFVSRWDISRARTGNLRDYNMSIAQKDEEGAFRFLDLKKSEVPAKNEELIGLNYDQFIKSIVLSQGDFAKFLKSEPKDRSALLEKITGTEIYRKIGRMAFEKQKQEKEILEKLRLRLGDIQLLAKEEVVVLVENIRVLNVDAKKGKSEHEVVSKKILLKSQLAGHQKTEQALDAKLKELNGKKTAMQADQERLLLHKQLLPLKSDITTLLKLETSIELLNKEKQHTLAQIEAGTSENENITKALQTKVDIFKILSEENTQLEPLLLKVKAIDREVQIEETKRQEIKKQHDQLINEIKKANTILKNQDEAHGLLVDKLARIDNFLIVNPELEKLSEVLPGLEHNKDLHFEKRKQIDRLLGKKFTQMQQLFKLQGSGSEILHLIQNTHYEIEEQKKSLLLAFGTDAPDREFYIEKIDAAGRQIRTLTDLLRLSKVAENAILEKNQSDALSGKLKTEIKNLEGQKEKGLQRFAISEKHIEELLARREKEVLLARYEDARHHLQPGSPCPLCGSCDHPYSENLEYKVDETSRLLDQEKKNLKQHQEEIQKTNEKLSHQKAMLDAKQERYLKLNGELEQAKSEINKLIEDSGLLPEETASADFNEKLKAATKSLEQYKQKLSLFKKLDGLNEDLQSLATLIEKAGEMADVETSIHQAMLPFANCLDANEKIETSIAKLKIQLSHYKEAHKQRAEKREARAELVASIAAKKQQTESLEKDHEKLRGALAQLSSHIDEKQKNRRDLFGDKDPEKEEKQARQRIQSLEKDLANLEKSLDINQEKLGYLKLQSEKTSRDSSAASIEKDALQKLLNPRLEALHISSCQEAGQKMMGEEEAAAIQEKVDHLLMAIQRASQSREDVGKQIEALREKDDPTTDTETLTQAANELEAKITSLNQEIGNLNARLAQDKKNRERFTLFSQEIKNQENEYARWEALNNLIGDAQGSRFSRFAQQLTLIQLLAKANLHLRKLTNRYLVINERFGENDELFVLDTFNGDDKRSAKTLSGGESFLISLALALGLSDMAGSKTRISSLFIDEGFGSLDQQTLDVALSTLERLQNETNRTIGIISHVEALKERITTQIEIQRDASGNSTLKIIA